MTTKTPRNSSALGIGAALDKLHALQDEIDMAKVRALVAVVDKFAEKRDAIMARVPSELHASLAAALKATEAARLSDGDAQASGVIELDDDVPSERMVGAARGAR